MNPGRWYARPDGRCGAVPRRPLFRRGWIAGGSRRAAVRRRRPRGARPPPIAQPVQCRPPDPARVARAGGGAVPRMARRRDPRARGRAGSLASLRGILGPDGIARERRGVVVSLAVEPYETRHVLPHERTHLRIRAERLRLLRAIRVQPEPILVLQDGPLELEDPERAPDLRTDGSRVWRLDRLRSRLARERRPSHRRRPPSLRERASSASSAPTRAIMALAGLDDGSRCARIPDAPRLLRPARPRRGRGRGGVRGSVGGHLHFSRSRAFERDPWPSRTAVAASTLVRGREDELDVELVDRYGLDGIGYTSQTRRGRRGSSIAGMRTSRSCSAATCRRRLRRCASGERMPPKSTYFFPKPLSGLLFHPLEP